VRCKVGNVGEVSAVVGMEGGAGEGKARWGRRLGDLRDEGLEDAIDLEIEKVRRTTCCTDFFEGSSDSPRETARPCCLDVRDASPISWTF